jgi:hypothetical protein
MGFDLVNTKLNNKNSFILIQLWIETEDDWNRNLFKSPCKNNYPFRVQFFFFAFIDLEI